MPMVYDETEDLIDTSNTFEWSIGIISTVTWLPMIVTLAYTPMQSILVATYPAL